MRKNTILFLIISFVSTGLFLNSSGTVFALEDSDPHNGHVVIQSDGYKKTEWAFSPSNSTYQAWGSVWKFKYKGYSGQAGYAKQNICVSRNNQINDEDDFCWLTVYRTWTNYAGGYSTENGSVNIPNDKEGDFRYVILTVTVDHADTSSDFTVESRQVSNTSLTKSPTTIVINQPFTLSWATEWAILDAYIEQIQGGGGFYDDVLGLNTDKTKSGTTAEIKSSNSGTKKFKLCASGPGVKPGSPEGGGGGGDSGPPWEAFLPVDVAMAAAGDGMTTDPCKELSFTVDKGATLRTNPVTDNDNNTAEYTFNAVQGGSDPANQTLTIRNNTLSSDRDLSWKADISYTSGNGWLSLQSTQGNVAAGNTVNKNVSADVSGLSAGTYKAKIIITGCSNGTDSTDGGCNANTISNGQYARTDPITDPVSDPFPNDYNPLTLNVTFVVGNSGTVNVTSDANNTDFGFGGTGAFGGCPAMTDVDIGETWTCNTVDAGTHTINPVDKSGYDVTVSPNATQTLSAGGTKTYNISYTAATGTISVVSNKRTNWNIDGPGSSDFSADNDDVQNYNDVPIGSYTISGVPASLIADSGKWWTLNPITPDTTQTLSSSGQTKTFTIDYTQTQPVCSPPTQTRQAGTAASFTATGGDGVFSWEAPGGLPLAGMGSPFSTKYNTYPTSPNPKTVTLTSNQGQTDTCSVTVTAAPPPTVDLDADGSDGPISIAYNTSAVLSWTSAETDTCTASNGWSGAKAVNGSESTGNLILDTTYTLTCDGPGGQASDSVTVTVLGLPTLSAGLSAIPSTGSAPLSSVLSASVGGTAVGTINYSFWWNCANTSNSVATVESDPACGALPSPAGGSCSSNTNGYKCNGMVPTSQSTIAHIYNSTSTGKVIVERDIAAPAEARTSITISSPPPSASGVIVTPPNYCVSGPAATVSWTYSDPMGSPQSAYRVQIDNNASFVSPEVDSAKTISTSTSYFGGTGVLQFGVNYNVRVMVWNGFDTPSAWSSTVGFSTPNYAYPQVDFSFSPTNPPISEPVQFTDATIFYAPGPKTWSWLFGDAGSSVLQNPTHTYTTEGGYGATLTATDNAGQACSLTKPVTIQKAIPVWKEVAPR